MTSVTNMTFTPINPISGQGQFDGVPLYFNDPTGFNSNGAWTLQITDNTAADNKLRRRRRRPAHRLVARR